MNRSTRVLVRKTLFVTMAACLAHATMGMARDTAAVAADADDVGLQAVSDRTEADKTADTKTEESAGSNLVIEEIVVTAQKRSENLQDVPMGLSAYDKNDLENRDFDNISDLANMGPSLQLGSFGPVPFLTIRGVGLENTTGGGDPGVAIHLDGVYLGRPMAALFTAFDTERVEVLRGPQGTLYGRNATGGSVNIITEKPTDEFGGNFDFTFGNYNWYRERGSINLPISDSVRARITGFRDDRDGFTDNFYPGGRDANDSKDWGIRTHLAIDLSDNADLLLSEHYVHSGGVGSKPELREQFPAVLAGPPFGSNGPMGGIRGPGDYFVDADGNPVYNDLTPFNESKDTRESQDNEILVLSGTLNWDFEDFALKLISGYAHSDFRSIQDADFSPVPLATLDLFENAHQFTQEIQFSSNDSGPLKWMIGGFYFTGRTTRISTFFNDRFDYFAQVVGNRSGVDLGGDINSRSVAVFSQDSYDLTDDLIFTAGVRWTHDEKKGINSNVLFAPRVDDLVGTNKNAITWHFSLDWHVNDDVLLYSTATKGFKSGGINQVAITSAGRKAVLDPEFITSYEAGIKSTLLDGQVQFNADFYHSDYRGIQFQIFEFGGPSAFNAKSADINGLEVEFKALLSESLSLDGSVGYTDAEYNAQTLGGVAIGGNNLSRTPKWTTSAGLTHEFYFSSGSSLRTRLDFSFTDDIFYTPFNRVSPSVGGSDLADSYTNLDLRFIWTDADEKYTIEAFATNLGNNIQEGNILRGIGFMDEPGGGGQESLTYNPPRQYGLRLGYRF